jgi:hypothetical protein
MREEVMEKELKIKNTAEEQYFQELKTLIEENWDL